MPGRSTASATENEEGLGRSDCVLRSSDGLCSALSARQRAGEGAKGRRCCKPSRQCQRSCQRQPCNHQLRTALCGALRCLPWRQWAQRHGADTGACRPAFPVCHHAVVSVARRPARQRSHDGSGQDDDGRRHARLLRFHRHAATGERTAIDDPARHGAHGQGKGTGGAAQMRFLPRRRSRWRPAGTAHRRAARGLPADELAGFSFRNAPRIHAGDDGSRQPHSG